MAGGAGKGGKFWQEKPFAEWTEKEVRKLLFDSPWVKKWRYSFSKTDIISRDTNIIGEEPNRRVPINPPVLSPEEERSAEQVYYISWISALPWKQAIVRYTQLQRQPLDVIQIERFLKAPESYIRINITTSDPELILPALKDKIMKMTYLQTKTRKKIPVLDYLPPTMENKRVALFIFPREEDGKPLLTLEDKEVTFSTRLNDLTLRCKFKLKDMVVNGKLQI
ncbi:hypothetical protein CEE39_02005 [bacterium (candidate division B38) B3_B38]|nr:MAG: hypothetical protein CEE39_02005 [bacterium (candidate division B38) B3_B38]